MKPWGCLMKWDQSLSIGCEVVDNQHKELICLVDQLETSLGKGIPPQQLGDAIKYFVSYTRHHFSAEENLMQSIDYDELKDHKELHNKLIQDVTDILIALKNGKIISSAELVKFLVDWVKKHVTEEDQKIGTYWRTKKTAIRQTECKIKVIEDRRAKTIARLEKLKELYRQRLIGIDDYKEQKLRTLVNLLVEIGINCLADGFADLDFFLQNNIICKTERKAIMIAFLEKSELEKGLSTITELEGKLLFLRTFREYDMITDEKFNALQVKILDAI